MCNFLKILPDSAVSVSVNVNVIVTVSVNVTDTDTEYPRRGAAASGKEVRILFRVGDPPQASPQENLKNLLKFGSQFDNIEIK